MFSNVTSNPTSQITGKERDKSGLDYFGARFFSGAFGRFTSPDSENFGTDITDRQPECIFICSDFANNFR